MKLNTLCKFFLLMLSLTINIYAKDVNYNTNTYYKYNLDNFVIMNSTKDGIEIKKDVANSNSNYKLDYLLTKHNYSANNGNVFIQDTHNFNIKSDYYINDFLSLDLTYRYKISEIEMVDYNINDENKVTNVIFNYSINDKISSSINLENLKENINLNLKLKLSKNKVLKNNIKITSNNKKYKQKKKKLDIYSEYSYNRIKFFNKIKIADSTTQSFGTTFYKKYNFTKVKIDLTAKNMLSDNSSVNDNSKKYFLNLSLFF